MGSWNKTCGISNLHICAGAPVYTFVMEENPHHDRCYATSFWRPLLLPFTSVYNDYGSGENNSETLQLILNGIKDNIVDVPLGKNQVHDIAVNAEVMNEELFFEAVHEGRLFIKDRAFSGQRKVDFVMMRKDVVDHICETWLRDMYVGNGKGTGGYGNDYIYYKFADIVAGIPEFLDRLSKDLLNDPVDDIEFKLPASLRVKYAARGISGLFAYEERNLVASYLSTIDDYRFSRIIRPTDIVVDLVSNGELKKAESILKDILLGSFINSFMEQCRKQWMPGCHEGSQSQSHTPYLALIGAMLTVLAKEKAEWEDENEGDFYE